MDTEAKTVRLRKIEEPSNLTDTNEGLQQNVIKSRKPRRPSKDILFCSFVILVSFCIITYRSCLSQTVIFQRLKVSKNYLRFVNCVLHNGACVQKKR